MVVRIRNGILTIFESAAKGSSTSQISKNNAVSALVFIGKLFLQRPRRLRATDVAATGCGLTESFSTEHDAH